MEIINSIIGKENFLLILSIVVIIMFIALIILLVKTSKLNKRYKNFMQKLGNGKDIQEALENYMYRVERVEKQNNENADFCKELNENLTKCIQKIGIIRYSAFKDTGSDLSFALALLDENDDGVVLNGIYSREISNIYAKPIEKGNSSYTLSDEERQAIDKAMGSKNILKAE